MLKKIIFHQMMVIKILLRVITFERHTLILIKKVGSCILKNIYNIVQKNTKQMKMV